MLISHLEVLKHICLASLESSELIIEFTCQSLSTKDRKYPFN